MNWWFCQLFFLTRDMPLGELVDMRWHYVTLFCMVQNLLARKNSKCKRGRCKFLQIMHGRHKVMWKRQNSLQFSVDLICRTKLKIEVLALLSMALDNCHLSFMKYDFWLLLTTEMLKSFLLASRSFCYSFLTYIIGFLMQDEISPPCSVCHKTFMVTSQVLLF